MWSGRESGVSPNRTTGPGPPEGHGTWGGLSGKERTALKREASLANGTKFERPPQGRRHGAYGHHTGKAIAKYFGVSRTTLDASEDLSAQILNNPDLSQKLLDELVPIIYRRVLGVNPIAHGMVTQGDRLHSSFLAALCRRRGGSQGGVPAA